MSRSTNRKIGYRGFLDEVTATRGGDFARVECEEGDIPATLLQTGPGIIVPKMRRQPMLEVRETRAEE